jgi:hypothetical protein
VAYSLLKTLEKRGEGGTEKRRKREGEGREERESTL